MLIACADKIHNITSLVEEYKKEGDKLWNKFGSTKEEMKWFYGEVLKQAKEKLKSGIVNDLDIIYKELLKIF